MASVGHLSWPGKRNNFHFPSLGFPICSVVVNNCPVLHGALRPLDVDSSRLDKSCLCTLFRVGSSTDGEQPRDPLDACEALKLSLGKLDCVFGGS